MFTNWINQIDGFGYTLDPAEPSYTGRWIAPYITDTLQKACGLIDPVSRMRYYLYGNQDGANWYPLKKQIHHELIPRLTSQRASIKLLPSYAPNVINADGTSGDLNSGKNTLDCGGVCEVSIEWLASPQNGFGINGAWVSVRGSGSFEEVGEADTIVTSFDDANNVPGKAGNFMAKTVSPTGPLILQKPMSINVPTDEITITYDWVEKGLVDLPKLQELRGTINYWDVACWPAGHLLYEGSDVEDCVSPLGYKGYKIIHHFKAKIRDWNLVPTIPKPKTSDTSAEGSGTNEPQEPDFPGVNWGYATVRPPYNSTVTTAPTFAIGASNKYDHSRNRRYKYKAFQTNRLNSVLFFYGLAATAPAPVVAVNPNTATATPPTAPTLET